MSELKIAGLGKHFGKQRVLDNITLDVGQGSLLALLGPSGSGKTTLLRLLCGFERCDGGSIHIGGRLVSSPDVHLPPEHRHIGYVPQEGALFPHLSVADNIVFGLPRAERRQRHRVAELLEMVGLPASFAERAPQQLSGGQQQRVALARALAPKPALVLLDEPFSALDAALRGETRQAVAAALDASNTTALMVTHDQAEALTMGSQVAVLWQGRLLQVASPQTLYQRPASAALADFVGDAILLPGEAGNGEALCLLGRLPLLDDMPQGAVNVLLRPEQICLQPAGGSAPQAEVIDVSYYGHDASVRLMLADGSLLAARVPGHRSPQPGQRVSLSVEGAVACFAAPQQAQEASGGRGGLPAGATRLQHSPALFRHGS
ncbi:ABC transporter ATP-binding protein [Chromobacterium sphagni]|uniref:Sugar ABC transporter n=1 Tax=Chromobacterium sphagni TaxID=1903179 RepID=A0A1S1X4F5_9NEIS|nr:ABC transporter ATP-binding protein [Chromobacterium sphagni]OHX14343.1 sugar ABC transporter [Chromobacterium sphagni]OHX16336.1 sugar ABC transporter [Chromobacterium sphagni]